MTAAGLPSRLLTCCRWSRPGGFYRRFERMMLALAAAGTEVHYAAAEEFPCRHERIVFHRMRLPLATGEGFLSWAAFFALASRELTALAQRTRPEAIAVFDGAYGWIAARASGTLRVPLIVFARQRPGFYQSIIQRHLARRGYRAADAIVVQSECGRAAMRAWADVPPERIAVLPNEVPAWSPTPDARRAARGRVREIAGAPADCFLAASVTRLNRAKGIETLLAAASRLRGAGARLILLGDGPLRSRYERLAGELGVSEAVTFAGWQRDVREFLAGCDAFITASLLEGAPNALLEALGAGLPCLGGDIPEVKEILAHPELLFPVSSAEALAERWAGLLSDESARRKCQQLSFERARAYAFDWDRALCDTVARAFGGSRGR